MTINKNIFSLVSAIGKKYSIPGGSSSKKYYQRNFEFEELINNEKVIILKLNDREIGRVSEFMDSYKNEEYYFAAEGFKLHFTTKKIEVSSSDRTGSFYIAKSEKLVYPETIII